MTGKRSELGPKQALGESSPPSGPQVPSAAVTGTMNKQALEAVACSWEWPAVGAGPSEETGRGDYE